MCRSLVILVVLLVLFVTGTATAQLSDPDAEQRPARSAVESDSEAATESGESPQLAPPKDRAHTLYERGAEAFQAGRYREAVDLFLEVARIKPSPELSYNVGLAYDAMGDTVEALKYYRDYVRREPEASDRAEVEASIHRLEEKLQQWGVQQVTIMSTPERAAVLVDGKPVGSTPWTGEIAPGKHRVLLSLAGHADSVVEFTLAPDRSQDISVKLNAVEQTRAQPEPQQPIPGATPLPPAEPTPDEQPAGFLSAPTAIALGAGAVALGGALVFELRRAKAEDDARDASTQVEAADLIETRDSHRTTARILLGVGGALVVAGGVLLTLDLMSQQEQPSQAAQGLGLFCASDGCAAVARGTF